jgi:hypothetical protein
MEQLGVIHSLQIFTINLLISIHQVEQKMTSSIEGYVSGVDVIRTVPVEQHVVSVVQRAASDVLRSK